MPVEAAGPVALLQPQPLTGSVKGVPVTPLILQLITTVAPITAVTIMLLRVLGIQVSRRNLLVQLTLIMCGCEGVRISDLKLT